MTNSSSAWQRPRSPRTAAFSPLLLLGLLAPDLRAWSAPGHRLVAAIAWQQLDAVQRQAAVRAIRGNPSFAAYFEVPAEVRDSALEDAWIFMQAAVWADLVRGNDDYHHSTWHYINEPLFLRPEDAARFRNGVPANLSRIRWPDAGRYNIVQALRRCRDDLRRPTADAAERGLAICWLSHLIGDLHQPLHATALFAEPELPHGDRGGNLIEVAVAPVPAPRGGDEFRAGPTRNLHSLWDRATPTTTADVRELLDLAAELIEAHDELGRQAAGSTNPETWLEESLELAREHVYDAGVRGWIEGNDPAAIEAGTAPRLDVPQEYLENARRVSRLRLVAAGYRLAATLGELMAEPRRR